LNHETPSRRSGRYYPRQRPTLPHTCACSTIGGIRLNFRVRNGNGCDPDPMTTGKLVCLGFPPRRQRRFGAVSLYRPAATRLARAAKSGSSQTILCTFLCTFLCKFSCKNSKSCRRQLNILQTVVSTDHTHAVVSACMNALLSRTPFAGPRKRSYGQASRLISIGKLNVSLRLHTRPITWSSSRSL
jgi:hypothetical protein